MPSLKSESCIFSIFLHVHKLCICFSKTRKRCQQAFGEKRKSPEVMFADMDDFLGVNDIYVCRYGALDEATKTSLARLNAVAVDIKPCYPLAGEDCQGALSF